MRQPFISAQRVRLRAGGRPTGSWPETGLEEISGDFLEADLWPASSRVCSAHNFRLARKPPETAASASPSLLLRSTPPANVRDEVRESTNPLSKLFCSSAALCRPTYVWVSPE